MSNSPPFSDSPRGSAFYPVQPTESPVQAPNSSDSSELGSFSDKLSALPGNAIPPSPYRSTRSEQSAIPTSPSAPSLRGLLATRPFPASPEGHDTKPLTAEASTSQNNSHQRVSFEHNRTSAPTPTYSPRAKVHIHPLLHEAVSQIARGIDSTVTRMNHSSDHIRSPSVVRLAGTANSPKKPGHESPPTTSAPHSRATSPLRHFGWSPFHRTREDAFVPVDPFRLRTRLRRLSFYSPDIENRLQLDPTCEENPFCCITPLHCSPKDRFFSFLRDARYFILDTLPRQIYLHLLLRIPSLYFSRIAKVYEDAQLSKPDLERMIDSYSSSRQQQEQQRIVRSSPIPPGAHYHPAPVLPFPDEWTSTNVSPALVRFKQSWEAFIDSLLREWKTLNLVSALLHSSVSISSPIASILMILHIFNGRAIISMFQSQVMANDPVIRTAALLSLTSALMSLSYGCIYIVRFGTMRSMFKATRWAEVGVNYYLLFVSLTSLSSIGSGKNYNVHFVECMGAAGYARCLACLVRSALIRQFVTHDYLLGFSHPSSREPSQLLSPCCKWRNRSMIFFIVAILAFVWRYGSSADPASPPLLSPTAAIGPRIAVSALFFLGLLYLAAIVKTLHNYGRTTENTLFRRTIVGSGMPDIAEDDAPGVRGSQRGRRTSHGRDGDHGHGSTRTSRGRGRTRHRHEQGATEPGGLSAVTGLGLTGLDEFASTRNLDDMPREKQQHRTEASV
ncbi:hypothetical protein J3R83DRAFT_387 [Lanmaoa asiatica]|nr:hypothetical protein J3R83DRAFT_387 [Lanmaoa asiatica]